MVEGRERLGFYFEGGRGCCREIKVREFLLQIFGERVITLFALGGEEESGNWRSFLSFLLHALRHAFFFRFKIY